MFLTPFVFDEKIRVYLRNDFTKELLVKLCGIIKKEYNIGDRPYLVFREDDAEAREMFQIDK